MESFHASLKKEQVYLRHYRDFDDAKLSLFDYIEGFYKRNRIHSVINFFTPSAYESFFLLTNFRSFVSNLLTIVQGGNLTLAAQLKILVYFTAIQVYTESGIVPRLV